MRSLFLSIAIAAGTLSALPAAAQSWHLSPAVRAQIGEDIRQLRVQIDRAAQRRSISFREASQLRRNALQLQRDYAQFSRDGLDRREVASLQQGLNRARKTLRLDQRDWDNHPG